LLNLKHTIIHKSLKLFFLKGFPCTSIGDIMQASGTVNTYALTEMIFSGMLGASVMYGTGKSAPD
jgi:hypothetical protein